MPSFLTYWHTVRYLRPIQFYGRIRLRLGRPRIDARPAPPVRERRGPWVVPAARRASLVGPSEFRFLNETHALDDHGWDDPALEKLWRYNLHYFDDLNAEDSGARVSWHGPLIERWIGENPPGVGTGWEPYPTSLRVVNWIKWAMAGNSLSPTAIHSLALQARWLSKRLEIHLLANHVFANAKALVYAGLFFDGVEAEAWLDTGFRILRREVPEQILADGGQFERSPMYHALELEDVLDLVNMTAAFADVVPRLWQPSVDDWRSRVGPMREWLATMCHPDGGVSHFNDSVTGIAPSTAALESFARQLGFPKLRTSRPGLTWLRDSGYIRVEKDDAVALLDVAPIGPDYIPGHAHADTLSFELSLFGQRVFVNSGTSMYGTTAERLRQRGTAAHNTVIIDNRDSSEVWGGFRVARRARPAGLAVSAGDDIEVSCAHDGYRRLPGKPEHLRRWVFDHNAVVVEDRVSGRFSVAHARFHLHPSIRIDDARTDVAGGEPLTLRLPEGRVARFTAESHAVRVEPAMWHPEFGRSEPTVCLVVAFADGVCRARIDWN